MRQWLTLMIRRLLINLICLVLLSLLGIEWFRSLDRSDRLARVSADQSYWLVGTWPHRIVLARVVSAPPIMSTIAYRLDPTHPGWICTSARWNQSMTIDLRQLAALAATTGPALQVSGNITINAPPLPFRNGGFAAASLESFSTNSSGGLKARGVHVELPFWFMGLVLLIAPLRTLMRRYTAVARRRKHLCVKCGYDLRGGNAVCPECGETSPTRTAA